MSELIDGSAIKAVDPQVVKNFAELSVEDQDKVREEMLVMQSTVAEEVLKSPVGWDIITGLAKVGGGKLLATSAFVIPVMASAEQINAELPDAEGFQKSFKSLREDIRTSADAIKALGTKHKGRSGEPLDIELPLLFELSASYNDEITRIETVIDPLIMSLCDQLRDGGIEVLGAPEEETLQ